MEDILKEIKEYTKYLINTQKLDIAFCDFYGKNPVNVLQSLSEFMIHQNHYCQKVKSLCLKNCLRQQRLVQKKSIVCDKPFWGVCYAGVYEYVLPIVENNVYYGFISATGYQLNEEFHHAPKSKLNVLSAGDRKTLNTVIPSESFLSTCLAPLKHSFKLLTYYYDQNEMRSQNKLDILYQTILCYLSENSLRPLTMSIIAQELHYSESYISHVFKQYKKQSIMQYLQELKIKKAKTFLTNTDKSILEISEMIGFQDSNYFSAVFKKIVGVSPRRFRSER